jgi:hypothetical protein
VGKEVPEEHGTNQDKVSGRKTVWHRGKNYYQSGR